MGKEFSAIILAAGKSERLGYPKLSLKYTDYITFVEHIVNSYNLFGCKEISIVLNQDGFKFIESNGLLFPQKTKVVVNEHPEWHRFYSLKIGIKSLVNKSAVFVHNVDNPFVNQQVLTELISHSQKADYINPEYKGKGGHPMLLSEKLARKIAESNEDQIHLKEFLSEFSRYKVLVSDEKILVNINTMDEYRKHISL